ncbi:Two-component response regulator [Quillaja saponaria]|uniref:Two-component response regulator n=1 Tax=Quillaja saponaria TaxID=32244 RepID=A0AAD7P5R4_QUISA|nr:Two-component response regulator [Quillaja saponaria]
MEDTREYMRAALINSVPAFARGLEILLVDNDSMSLMYLSSLLEQYSFKVTTTELASVALSKLSNENHPFKLVMANSNIRDLDILSFLPKLFRKEIPAICVGARAFLDEPISFEDLQDVWQYACYRNQENKTQKRNCERRVNYGNKSGGIKIKEVGDKFRPTTRNNLHGTEKLHTVTYPEVTNKQKEVQVGLVGESHAKNLQHTCIQQLMTTDFHVKGRNGMKRTYTDNEGNQKEKRTKFISKQIDFAATNYKTAEEEWERRYDNDGSTDKTSHFSWSSELHHKFEMALSELGDNARPKSLLKMMNEPNLPLCQVASHLQKYKAQVQRIIETGNSQLSSVNQSSISGRNQFAAIFGRQSSLPDYGFARTCIGIGGNTTESITFNSLTDSRLTGNVGSHDQRTSKRNFGHIGLFGNSTPYYPTFPYSSGQTLQFLNVPQVNQEIGCTQGFSASFTSPNGKRYQNQSAIKFTSTNEELEFSKAQIILGNATIPIKHPMELTNHESQNIDAVLGQSVPAPSMNQDIGRTPGFTASFSYLNDNQYQNQLPSYISGTTEGIEFSPVQITTENATIPNKLPTGLTNNGSQEKDAAVGQSIPAPSVDQNQ